MTNKVLVTYRCPRKGAATSRHLSATLTPDNRVVFSGGPYGTHTIEADSSDWPGDPLVTDADNLKRVNAHWRGYVAAAAHARAKPRGVTKAAWTAANDIQAIGYRKI